MNVVRTILYHQPNISKTNSGYMYQKFDLEVLRTSCYSDRFNSLRLLTIVVALIYLIPGINEYPEKCKLP